MEITAETYKEIFNTLNDIDLKGKVKEKMGLSYLSWAYAWGVLKQNYPTAKMNIYERKVDVKKTITHKYEDGTEEVEEISYTNEVPYFTDGMTAFVKVGVDINGIEYVEQLPVMNNKNQSVSLSLLKMTDVNKAIQRAFVKACARHGLGLYIYAGEDLPESEKNAPVVISDATDFKSVQTDVINLVTKMQNDPEVVRYIQEMFPGTRLSQTTEEHLDKLIAARTYLSSRQ